MNDRPDGTVLVVGGGIGGIQSALNLSEAGYTVYIVESSPSIGGAMASLDKTFPTNDCAMCIMGPKMSECTRRKNIHMMTLAEVAEISGSAGDFRVLVRQKPRYVDPQKCIACGACAKVCPEKTDDAFNASMISRSAISIFFPQAVPACAYIDMSLCTRCGDCQKVCKAEAIDFEDRERYLTLHACAVVLSAGAVPFDPSPILPLNYRRLKNVITSFEFERILSASGPTKGRLIRPSDGKTPESIAFVLCAGSRDVSIGRGFCSGFCCMAALKEAVVAKEHAGQPLDVAIYGNDIRAFGKNFETFYQSAVDKHEVRIVRSKVFSIDKDENSENLNIVCMDENGGRHAKKAELAVLSVGLQASGSLDIFTKNNGVGVNADNFIATRPFSPVTTLQPGVFACGTAKGPKDIPETVSESFAASCESAILLRKCGPPVQSTRETISENPDIRLEPPRIGVFVCCCGSNIAGVADVDRIVKNIKKSQKDVVVCRSLLFSCSQDGLNRIRNAIVKHELNRVVVSSCSPHTHESIFREVVAEAGLNPYLFEMANIRNHCTWVHRENPEKATEKAEELTLMAIARARLLEPLHPYDVPVDSRALVVGGGISGMTAARALADMGFPVALVEQADQLGGLGRDVRKTIEGQDVGEFVNDLVHAVKNHPNIDVMTGARVVSSSGVAGDFSTAIDTGSEERVAIRHGATVLATGAQPCQPDIGEYLYGEDPRVVTQLSLEKTINDAPEKLDKLRTVVMIQCVGSRNEKRPYCSRVCCAEAIKNALELKKQNRKCEVVVLNRDIRSYGFLEHYYWKARQAGVRFVKFTPDSPPAVEVVERNFRKILEVDVKDALLNRNVRVDADLLVLSEGIVAQKGVEEISAVFGTAVDDFGFFMELHPKLEPVDTATPGIYICGLAHGPKLIDECIGQAKGAAMRAMTILSQETLRTEGVKAVMKPAGACRKCLTCLRVCPFNAVSVSNGKPEINPLACRGCGICAAECPAHAIDLLHYKDDQILAQCDIGANREI